MKTYQTNIGLDIQATSREEAEKVANKLLDIVDMAANLPNGVVVTTSLDDIECMDADD